MRPLTYVALLARQTTRRSERVAAWIDRLEREHGLVLLFDSPTLTLYGPPSLPRIELPGQAGVLVGYAFDRSTYRRIEQAIVALCEPAEMLFGKVWGGYV